MNYRWKSGLVIAGCVVLGAVIGRLFPPFVLDQPFWRDFFSGPPVAGIFALAGAGIAYIAARLGTNTAKAAARRQEWWDRAEWALNLAISAEESTRRLGLRVLTSLKEEASETEYAMILSVTEGTAGVENDVEDNSLQDGHEQR